MKRLLLPTFLSTIMFLNSCNREQNIQPSGQAEYVESFTQLNEEKVRVPKGVDSSAIKLTSISEVGKYVNETFNRRGARLVSINDLDPQAILDILKEKSKKYPQLDFSLDLLPQDQLERVKQDFPGIRTQEDAYNKRETIAQYYENLLRFDILDAINNTSIPKKIAGGRTKAFWDVLPDGWPILVSMWPTAVGYADQAKAQVDGEVNLWFPGGHFQGASSNAFRHGGWCGLIARKLIAGGKSKQNGCGEAGIITSAYECSSVNWDPGQPSQLHMQKRKKIDNAMDLWNNSIGRSYIYHKTTYGIFGVRKDFPSERRLLDEMRSRSGVEQAFNWTWISYYPSSYDVEASPATILGLVQSDPEAAWETLYRHTASDWYNMTILSQGQPYTP